MWLDGQPITYAGHLLSRVRRFLPELRWRIPRSRQYFANWQSMHVTHQAAPLPAEVVMALAGLAVGANQKPLAAILLLGFLAFLRTGEIVSLTAAKLAVNVPEGRVILALPGTKTSRQKEETVMVEDALVAALVLHVIKGHPGLKFWEGSLAGFRATFRQLCDFFELGPFHFTPYSIRRGGASYAFATGAAFDELLQRGRWQSSKTARIYLDTGRAALIQTQFNLRQQRLIDEYGQKLKCFCEQLR